MSGGIEAAGDIATGMLVGRAVESRAGEGSGGAHGSGVCLNCGTALIGEFCHACGQNGHVHKTLTSIGHDLLHGVFHFEGKVWRTLPMLVVHPGALTRRYIDGERARFVSPLAMFLFFVFLMFAALHSMSGDDAFNMEPTPPTRAERLASVDKATAKAQAALSEAQALKAKGGEAAADADEDIADSTATLRELERDRVAIASGAPVKDDWSSGKVDTGWPQLDKGIKKANANRALAFYKLQSSAYKYSWVLIPISVPFVALLFLWRRGFKLYDHAIFVTYSLAFMMLLATFVTTLMMVHAPRWTYANLFAFAPPAHMFFQLRGTYRLGWFSALWRTFALLLFASFTILLFTLLLLGLGLME